LWKQPTTIGGISALVIRQHSKTKTDSQCGSESQSS
jgi:hypothetical protein